MAQRIAPQPSLPEFYVEVGYLNSLSMLWKLRRAPVYESSLGVMDFTFLAQWQVYRHTLTVWRSRGGNWISPHNDIVRDCLHFVDALIEDWQLELSGKTPKLPLDIGRLEELNQHTRALESIPGDKWEIKY